MYFTKKLVHCIICDDPILAHLQTRNLLVEKLLTMASMEKDAPQGAPKKAPKAPSRSTYNKSNVVPDKLYPAFEKCCLHALNDLKLKPTTRPMPLLGTRPLDRKSTSAYTQRIRKFVAFALTEGFYDSLLPFYPFTPKGTVSVDQEAMIAFIYSVYSAKGEPVFDMHEKPVMNARGESQILGLGSWNDPDILDGLRTAVVHVLKNAHGFGDSYWDKCDACVTAVKNRNFLGCDYHSPPRTIRTGNVMCATAVEDTIAYIRMNSSHVVKGACHLLPSHVRKIREYVSSSNDIFWFEIYVLLLMSIELYLRKMEYSSLTLENFNKEMFVMRGEFDVKALNLKVKGKKKRKKKKKAVNDTYPCWRTLYIWGDTTYADVDLKRHLLAYLYCIKWKGGTLFPTKKELENPPQDGIYTTHMSEDELYKSLKYIFATVLKRKDKLTSHSGRKSGYLWDRMRGADSAQLMTAAQHDVFEVAARYAKDCDAIKDTSEIFDDPNQRLGQFKSCFCAGDETAVDMSAPGKDWQCDLPDLVVGFMEKRVGILPTEPRGRHPNFVMHKILLWESTSTPIDDLKGHLKDVSHDKTKSIMNCVYTLQAEAVKLAKVEA